MGCFWKQILDSLWIAPTMAALSISCSPLLHLIMASPPPVLAFQCPQGRLQHSDSTCLLSLQAATWVRILCCRIWKGDMPTNEEGCLDNMPQMLDATGGFLQPVFRKSLENALLTWLNLRRDIFARVNYQDSL